MTEIATSPQRLNRVSLRLRCRLPFDATALLSALRAHAVPGLDRHNALSGEHTRVIRRPGGPAVVSVKIRPAGHVETSLRLADPADLAPVVASVRRWLDLDADPRPIDEALGADRRLQPLVAARPGLRVLGSTDGFETAVLIVLGQQVSVAGARTLGGRLVAAYGEPAGDGLAAFPPPAILAGTDPDELQATIGLTRARARTVHALAAAANGLELDLGADRQESRRRLLAIPGVGPWTADCLALRALGDPDAFPADDLVLKRALGVGTGREATALSEAWRPWRAYALFHLWTAHAFCRKRIV